MVRLLFWVGLLAIAWLVLSGALPVPGVADEEVVFATTPPVATCGSAGCLAVYTLEVANPGRSAQESVKVRLRGDTLANPAIPPTLRRASETASLQAGTERGTTEAYQLGTLAPEERVALVFALRAPSREAVPGWDRVLVGVEPAHGSARPADPGALAANRLVHAAGRTLDRIVNAIRGAIAS